MNIPHSLPYPTRAQREAHRARAPARDWNEPRPDLTLELLDRWLNEWPFVPTAEDCEVAVDLVQLATENAARGDPFAIWLLNEIDRARAALAVVS